jgi:hypothetical protein
MKVVKASRASNSRTFFKFRALDYMELVNNNRRGLWNVPYVSSCYLVTGTLLTRENLYTRDSLDPDMAFAANVRNTGAFLFVSNR